VDPDLSNPYVPWRSDPAWVMFAALALRVKEKRLVNG